MEKDLKEVEKSIDLMQAPVGEKACFPTSNFFSPEEVWQAEDLGCCSQGRGCGSCRSWKHGRLERLRALNSRRL